MGGPERRGKRRSRRRRVGNSMRVVKRVPRAMPPKMGARARKGMARGWGRRVATAVMGGGGGGGGVWGGGGVPGGVGGGRRGCFDCPALRSGCPSFSVGGDRCRSCVLLRMAG